VACRHQPNEPLHIDVSTPAVVQFGLIKRSFVRQDSNWLETCGPTYAGSARQVLAVERSYGAIPEATVRPLLK
jgi:hypothetical protein